MILVAVSEDIYSLRETLELANTMENVIPCAGYHPWNFRGNGSLSEAFEVARLAYHLDIHCIGEIGLDRKFVPKTTWNNQLKVIKIFLQLAREINAYITLHAPNAWKDVLRLLIDYDIEKAMFHWYTGPVDLANLIINHGYYISINPAVKIQEKHRKIARETPLNRIILESDGPYNYKGLKLDPQMIPNTIDILSKIKNLPQEEIIGEIKRNSERLLYA